MPHDTSPRPIDRCPSCTRPWRGPRALCDCGEYRTPPTLDTLRLAAVRQAKETLRLARRGRILRERYAELEADAA